MKLAKWQWNCNFDAKLNSSIVTTTWNVNSECWQITGNCRQSACEQSIHKCFFWYNTHFHLLPATNLQQPISNWLGMTSFPCDQRFPRGLCPISRPLWPRLLLYPSFADTFAYMEKLYSFYITPLFSVVGWWTNNSTSKSSQKIGCTIGRHVDSLTANALPPLIHKTPHFPISFTYFWSIL